MLDQPRLHVVPMPFALANMYIRQFHRHHPPSKGHKFSVGVADEANLIRGAAVVGRPVSRHLDTGDALEVTRLVTDGCPNACSALYGACRRIAREMGYHRIYTYILASEPGTSLRAAGWTCEGTIRGHSWDMPSRPRKDHAPTSAKVRWIALLKGVS